MSEIELKPCPFCGGAAKALHGAFSDYDEVQCQDCFAEALLFCWNSCATPSPQWQPIESAPKDGTAVLATSAHMTGSNGEPVAWAAVFDQERNRWVATWDGEPLNDATHWQPLPAPPEVEG